MVLRLLCIYSFNNIKLHKHSSVTSLSFCASCNSSVLSRATETLGVAKPLRLINRDVLKRG